ncbi:hypothetical protein KR093_008725 [Drosophila rubida]|uniref:Integumentary mucin C.1 n=1 Tax=Drosophila rubida TaxID=30044 RepID=A0AAD4K179_9MUSC|nr:hypothetical protein KR093_008725 [Drosophila rubida]
MQKFGALMLLASIGLAMGQIDLASSQCKTCQSANDAYCESESTYYICLGKQRVGPFNCNADEVCTNSLDICVNKDEVTGSIKNVCADSGCEVCATDKKFTCVSRTQAARCINGNVSPSLLINCEADEVCISEAETLFGTVCVANCAANFANLNATCSNTVYTPPTETPPTTPSPIVEQSICQSAAATKTGRYFFAYADSSCRTYVYCERSSVTSTTFTTTFSGSCASPNIYFNTANGRCESSIPDSCRNEARTTTTTEASVPTTTTTQASVPTTTTTQATVPTTTTTQASVPTTTTTQATVPTTTTTQATVPTSTTTQDPNASSPE